MLFLGVNLLSNTGFAAKDLSLEELKKAQAKIKSFDYLDVDFDLVAYGGLRKKESKSVGHAAFSKPEKFRWQTLSPIADEWLFNGKDLINYKPTTKEAIRFNSTGATAGGLKQIIDIVMNFDSLLQRYDVKKATQAEDKIAVELTPKKSGDVASIDLTLALDKGFVSYVKIYYSNGNNSAFFFKNPKKDSIPQGFFDLPSGVKVKDGQ
jgi:outer membrane lipoprotein-sorting protein